METSLAEYIDGVRRRVEGQTGVSLEPLLLTSDPGHSDPKESTLSPLSTLPVSLRITTNPHGDGLKFRTLVEKDRHTGTRPVKGTDPTTPVGALSWTSIKDPVAEDGPKV